MSASYIYTESPRRFYATAPAIHQSRASSSDSRSSYDSRSSTESRYSESSRSSEGYYGVSQSQEPKEHKYRVPDAEKKYIPSITRNNVEVIHQFKPIYDPEAPVSSDATPSQYKESQKQSSSRRSSHKHSSDKKSSHRR